MTTTIREEGPEALAAYAAVPIAFRVRSRLRVEWVDNGLGGIRLCEEAVDPPCVKDYDAVAGSPTEWGRRWDVSGWGIFVARDGREPVGWVAVAHRTPGPYLLDGRDDVAAVVDLRVRPERRREGIGRRLFERAASRARDWNCRDLKVE